MRTILGTIMAPVILAVGGCATPETSPLTPPSPAEMTEIPMDIQTPPDAGPATPSTDRPNDPSPASDAGSPIDILAPEEIPDDRLIDPCAGMAATELPICDKAKESRPDTST